MIDVMVFYYYSYVFSKFLVSLDSKRNSFVMVSEKNEFNKYLGVGWKNFFYSYLHKTLFLC